MKRRVRVRVCIYIYIIIYINIYIDYVCHSQFLQPQVCTNKTQTHMT